MTGHPLPWISMISTYIPLAAAFTLALRQRLTKDLKVLLLFLVVAGVAEAVAMTYVLLSKPNFWMMHIYTPIEFSLTVFLLSLWLRKDKTGKYIRAGILIYLLLYAIVKIYHVEDFSPITLNYLTRPVSQLLAGGVAIYTLHRLWYYSEHQLHKNYRFWITAAFLVYNIVGVIIFALTFIKSRQGLLFLVSSHALVNITHNLLFTAGIFCAMRFEPAPLDDTAQEQGSQIDR